MVFNNINFIDEFGKEQKLEFNNIYCVDCMKILKLMPDKSIDLCIVDPPYGLGKRTTDGGSIKNTQTKFKEDIRRSNWDDFKPSKEYFDELFRVSKNQIIWGGNYFDLPPTRTFVCWEKMVYIPTMSQVEYAWTSFDTPARLVKINNTDKSRIHPTQKPIELYEWLLNNYAKKGNKILDTHLGSASSIIACKKLGFEYVGFELDEEYFDKAKERIEKFESQENLFGILNEIEKPKQESLF